MVERKLYKTKLCLLYQKGRCHRLSCSFAHGDVELRRFSGSFNGYSYIYSFYEGEIYNGPFGIGKKALLSNHYYVTHVVPCNGRREYRAGDLRDKLERRYSSPRRYSPRRDARGRHTSHGYSPSRSLADRRNRRKKQHLDGQSDFSGSSKILEGTVERVKNKRATSDDSKGVHKEQLMQVQSDIDMLEDHKCELEMYLEERAQEVESLTSQIEELEMQLFLEKEECKRTTSKTKKFIKAHNHCSRVQDELKRSQARLQKLGDQLGSNAARTGANEEDSNINILSDEETVGNHVISPRYERQKNASPSKKRLQINMEAAEEPKSASLTKGEETIRLENFSRWKAQRAQSNNNKDAVDNSGNDSYRSLANEDQLKRGKNFSANGPLAVKLKGSDSGFVLPSTGMAAHAADEGIEMEEKFEALEMTAIGVAKGSAYEITESVFPLPPPPPPPPFPQNAYSEYAGDDKSVKAEQLEEEMVDVEIV